MTSQSLDSLEDSMSETISVSEELPISSELAEISPEQMQINDQLQKDENSPRYKKIRNKSFLHYDLVNDKYGSSMANGRNLFGTIDREEGQGSSSSLRKSLESEEAPILTPGGRSSSGRKRSRGRKSAEELSMVEIQRDRNVILRQLLSGDWVKDEIRQAIEKIRANERATMKEKVFGMGLCKNREVRLIMMSMTDLELQLYLRMRCSKEWSFSSNPHMLMQSNVPSSRPPHVIAPTVRSDFPSRNLSHDFTPIDLTCTRTAMPRNDYGTGGSGHDCGSALLFALFLDDE